MDDAASVNEDSLTNLLTVIGNDTDLDVGDTLSLLSVGATSGTGTAIQSGDQVDYVPAAGFVGQETFSYVVTDVDGLTDTGTVTVTVDNVNDAPVAVDDAASVDEDSLTNLLTVIGNDTDLDVGDTLRLLSVGATSGTGTASQSGDQVDYVPAAGFVGQETFSYVVTDVDGLTDTGTVTVTVDTMSEAPVAVDDAASVDEDRLTNLRTVLGPHTDLDAGPPPLLLPIHSSSRSAPATAR